MEQKWQEDVLIELRRIVQSLVQVREAVEDVGVAIVKLKPCAQELPPEVQEQMKKIAQMFAGTPLSGAIEQLVEGVKINGR